MAINIKVTYRDHETVLDTVPTEHDAYKLITIFNRDAYDAGTRDCYVTLSSFRYSDGTLVPAYLDPEPDRVTRPAEWMAWRHRDMLRMEQGDLIPTG